MRKVKGLVLQSSEKHVILLTRDGEYLRLPASGRFYETGSQVEIRQPFIPSLLSTRAWGLTAAVLLILLLSTYVWNALYNQPRAYLALDINPSLTLVLNSRGTVLGARAHNLQGEDLLAGMEIRGLGAEEALESLMIKAFARFYLYQDQDNRIFLALAGPPNFPITQEELHAVISRSCVNLEVDAYLRIRRVDPQRGEEALRRGVSMNAQLLGEELKESQGKDPGEPGPPESVREFIREFNPIINFKDEEFIPGKGRENGKPDGVGPPGEGVGPPGNPTQN